MRCNNCNSENPDTAKFCIKCGAPQNNICQRCGAENPREANFCSECGTRLGEKELSQINKTPDVENRQLTILFCDIVDYSALTELLDSEDLHDFIRLYQETCAEAINHYDGHLAKYLGDGLLIYFGYPMAHEDDAERAVRAGLQILNAISELSDSTQKFSQSVQIRIGIHTGQVMAGEMGVEGAREEMAVLGETPNIASRLMDIALPNTVLMSSGTYKLVEGLFDCKDLGKRTLKGVSNKFHVYQVLGEKNYVDRFELATNKGLTPFVGRDSEAELLLERWEHARSGSGQVVMISGEAGIGKSRLVQFLKQRLSEDQYLKIESHCSPYYQNSAFHSITENLNRAFFKGKVGNEEKIPVLEEALLRHGFSLDEMIPLIAPLLSIPVPERYSSDNLTPEMQKRKTVEALLTWALAEAEQQPVLRIFEDLQWVDPSTLEYLGLLINQLPSSRIFLLLTFRPDFQPPWKMHSHMTHITLNRLTWGQMDEMVKGMRTDNVLPSELETQIIDRADGIPLFLEELYKMVSESELLIKAGTETSMTDSELVSEIPMTLRDSLTGRLDVLGQIKELAQLSATLGREFSYDLIGAVSSHREDELIRQLTKLIESEILDQKGIPPHSRYFFRHHLIQDAAYQSMPKRKRQKYHRKIATILEEQFPETLNTQPELIALHFTNAGQKDQAVQYWHAAGKRAIERSAHIEAINHLNEGLKLLKEPSNIENKDEIELELLTLLGTSYRVTRGFGSPEVQKVYIQAREVSKRVKDVPKLLPVLRGISGYYLARAQFATAHELGKQCFKLAENVKSTKHLIQAHYILGASLFCTGDFSSAAEQSEKGYSLYSPEYHRSDVVLYGQDPGVACLFWTSLALWFLGYVDKALKKAKEALELAKSLSHPYSIAVAYDLLALIYHLRGDAISAYKCTQEAIALSSERGFEFFLEMGRILEGCTLVEQGKKGKGISMIQDGYEQWMNTGAEIFRSYWLAFMAESYLKLEEIQTGLNLIERVLDSDGKNEETFYHSELYRLKGELLLAGFQEAQSESEICFRKAIEIAHEQYARSLELRSIVSFCNLLMMQKREREAHDTLAEIYNWFSEGFDTRDLRQAKALLDNLS